MKHRKLDTDTILIIAHIALILLGIGAIVLMVMNWQQEYLPVTDGKIII